MAEVVRDIKVRLVIDGKEVDAVLRATGKRLKDFEKDLKDTSEAGRLGMWSLGESAENMAQRLGVPNQMSRQLGNSVERMAASMGTAAVAMGVVGLAAMAAYAVWAHLNDEKKKAHEELEKSVDAMLKEETALYANRKETEELKAANENLRRVKKQILDQDFAKWVAEEREEIKKLKEEIAGGGGLITKFTAWLAAGFTALEDEDGFWAEYNRRLGVALDEKERIVTVKEAGMAVKRAQRNANALAEEDAFQRALRDIKSASAIEEEKIFDLLDARALASSTLRNWLSEKEAERATWALGVALSAATNYYRLKGQTDHKAFVRYKQFAKAEAAVSTAVTAINVFKSLSMIPYVGYTLGAAAAAAVIAYGGAQMKAIDAQQPGVAPSVGTFSANPVTGLPESGGGGTNVVININGQQAGMYELAGGVLKELDRNNGSIDGYSIIVERSA